MDRSNRPITRHTVRPEAMMSRMEAWLRTLRRFSFVGKTSGRAQLKPATSSSRNRMVP